VIAEAELVEGIKKTYATIQTLSSKLDRSRAVLTKHGAILLSAEANLASVKSDARETLNSEVIDLGRYKSCRKQIADIGAFIDEIRINIGNAAVEVEGTRQQLEGAKALYSELVKTLENPKLATVLPMERP